MEIALVATILSAALVAGGEAEGLSPAAAEALRSLQRTLSGHPGAEPVSAAGLAALRAPEVSKALALAQVVLAEIDPPGTAAGHYEVPGDSGEVRTVRRSGAGRQAGDPVRQLSDNRTSESLTVEAPHGADRIDLVLGHRSPQHTEAMLAVAQELLADRERAFGPEHPETLDSRTDLAHLYHAAGRTGEAIEAMTQVVAGRHRGQGAAGRDTLAAEATLDDWRRG